MNNIVLFENERVDDLYPFSVNHCSWEIRCGGLRLFEKIKFQQPKANIFFKGRKEWVDSFLKRFENESDTLPNEDVVFLSGNIIMTKNAWDLLDRAAIIKDRFKISANGDFVGFFLKNSDQRIDSTISSVALIDLNSTLFENFEVVELNDIMKIDYIWDSIFLNGKQIAEDSIFLKNYHSLFQSDHHNVIALNPRNILIGKNSDIYPSVVLDATDGFIVIGDNVKIMPQSTIIGPCYIGNNTIIKIGAKIYGDNSIGEWCKIGGELENSIIHGYSNKQHEGFLGHSYIGEWVNLGADTNNSDLKNTYSEISMTLPHKDVKTNRRFLGLVCGDHTKTGINSMFTTGTVAGVCGILVKEWFLPNYINSFTWGGKQDSPHYKFEKAIETAKIVMERRKRTLSDEEIVLLRIEYDRICKK